MSYEEITIEASSRTYENLLYEKGDDQIVRLTLNRPEKLNALNTPLMSDLKAALEQAELDEEIRVIIIKGAGRAFSAGYDLTPPPKGEGTKLPIELANKYHMKRNHDVWFTIWNLLKPVIAQVHGYCLAGGSELAFMCDLTIMAEDAQTGYPPVRSISTPDTLFHPWLGGIKMAKRMLFTGDTITGKEAAACGMATMAVPADKLEEETENIARRIALVPTDMISLTKKAINHSFEIMGFKTALEYAAEIHDLSHTVPSAQTFINTRNQKGLKAALVERDEKFGDLRTSEEALKGRLERGE
ncbi:MAG: enoyl-CoA hydratase/isomerase family protein [SAR324 cluster bacterium]|nr:enoyl-CoA hydratase/isomerase family protein [SAR324 cluster bacterium]